VRGLRGEHGLGRIGTAQASAYVDPAVCIVLSLIFLKKPLEILRESMADLVDANPYADTVNAVEDSARALAARFQLEGLEWVRVRKAGRRVFVMVSFFEHPGKSLEGMDIARQAVEEDMMLLHPRRGRGRALSVRARQVPVKRAIKVISSHFS
jgi:predicted Co/Zn/Cd cation transporter (cation efflux family)